MEAYSRQLHAAILRDVQQATTDRLRQLLAYFRRRRGPGLALVETELEEREKRHQQNHTPITRTTK
jgi:hypothetical protein